MGLADPRPGLGHPVFRRPRGVPLLAKLRPKEQGHDRTAVVTLPERTGEEPPTKLNRESQRALPGHIHEWEDGYSTSLELFSALPAVANKLVSRDF